MSDVRNPGAPMRAVTISREYGSGGGEIATRLAQKLGWQLIDHEIVVAVARDLGVSVAEVEARDERAEGVVSRLLSNMQMFEPSLLVAVPMPIKQEPQAYALSLHKVIKAAANTGQAVIVGRAGQVILADRPDVLHVRVVAPLDLRIKYVMQREGMTQEQAKSRIQLKDRDRMRFLQNEYQQHADDAHLYDLVINTRVLDLDSAVDLIAQALESKGRQLGKSPEELGPEAGLGRYPGQPGDLPIPDGIVNQE